METIGFIGLGLMGSGMAHNLLKAGYPLRVYNRSAEKAQPLIEAGATAARTPAEAAQGADVIISMVGDDTASRAIWLGTQGALDAAKPGAIVIESSTLSLDWVRELYGLAKAKGLQFIDSPVAGSKVAARDGALTLYIGAESQALVDQVMPIFKTVSQNQAYFGPVGSGAVYKLINNMLVAVHIAALGEGLALAQSAGLNQDLVVQTLLNGPSASPTVKGKMPSIVARNYDDVHFELQWMLKDATYALKLADSLKQPLSIVDATKTVYANAVAQGLAEADFAAVTEVPRTQNL
jgi:3-hydroxyisobutyrate dehydrogenase